jgi:hypothetical protein
MEQEQGLIAILDALGAATYTDSEIEKFLDSRGRVIALLHRSAHANEVRGDIQASQITTFTFNDTVLIVYRIRRLARLADFKHFGLLLRKFCVDSLAKGILFRGSLSAGSFYVDDDSNTVMGSAVTDAPAWYDSADWIGVHATPHATLLIQELLAQGQGTLEHVLVDYSVPFKDQRSLFLKAINWPKLFVLPHLAPAGGPADPRAKCLWLLTKHRVPRGTEAKYFNSVAFFDHCVHEWQKSKKRLRANSRLQPTAAGGTVGRRS